MTQVNQLIRRLPIAKILGISMVAWSGVSEAFHYQSLILC